MASTPARGGVGDTLIVAPGVLTQYGEGCGHRQAALPGEHALGLFDDHSTVQGSLQLRGDWPRIATVATSASAWAIVRSG